MEGSRTPVRESIEFARIVAFTDGVFAIAITLLVLSLEVPSDLQASALHAFLIDSWPQLFAYFLSFAVSGASGSAITTCSRCCRTSIAA